jgi:hypothetical protein
VIETSDNSDFFLAAPPGGAPADVRSRCPLTLFPSFPFGTVRDEGPVSHARAVARCQQPPQRCPIILDAFAMRPLDGCGVAYALY